MSDATVRLICDSCGRAAALLDWRCPACSGALHLEGLPAFDPAAIRQHEWSLWRYADMLPAVRRFSLGEGMTPLVPANVNGLPFLAKLEYLLPTGSYKDRGVAVMLNYLLGLGVTAVVEDSSGNAGASVAAYAGGIGMTVRIFVPETAAERKKAQIACYGAELVEVPGPRAAVTAACEAAAQQATYASHAWHPCFIAGEMTVAWELWEQMGGRTPDAVVCPVGQGGLLLGLVEGFRALLAAGVIAHLPRFFAVQSAACDPVVRAWEAGADTPAPVESGDTIADGIKIAHPVRGQAILATLRGSGGAALRVDDSAIHAARQALAAHGLFVEPTSAVPVAALPAVQAHLGPAAEIVVPLTGSGLKASWALAKGDDR